MAATMTRLPSDSFWPSGAVENDLRFPFPSGSDSSIISPLTLPRGASGYFDQVSAKKAPSTQVASASQMPLRHGTSGGVRGNRVYSPLSPGARVPTHLAAQQHRSTSLPPMYRSQTSASSTSRSVAALGLIHGPPVNGALAPGVAKPPNDAMSMTGSTLAGHPRTISADSASAPSQTQMVRRLIQQNSRIREAWEAERKYMEANRERAEEVYKEERALMEEERMEWEEEKVALLQEIDRLRQHVLSLGGNTGRPRGDSIPGTKHRFASSQPLRGGAAWEASPESMRSSTSSQGNEQRNIQAMRNAVSAPQLSAEGPSSQGFGLESLSFRASSSELPAVPETEAEEGLVPIVDVQEIHPELEGIPIKANTIQKPTFTDSQTGSRSTSTTVSPPSGSARPKVTAQGSREQTLQVLAAEESTRLTMHAGHTPSHSLSLLATVASSGAQTARSSGESTPTMLQHDGPTSQGLAAVDEQPLAPQNTVRPSVKVAADPEQLSQYHDEPEPTFEPTEDRELKGPLMVRNVPAHDEIFFRRLSDKLEEVRKDHQAALPAVLKDIDQASDSADQAQSEISDVQPDAQPDIRPEIQRDGSLSGDDDSGTEKDLRSPRSETGEVLDIPLKFKSSMNFGAPFGTFR